MTTKAPTRIQRRRTKGWKMPPNTVYVGRPTKWGNPFRVFGQNEYLYCDASHRRKILSPWVIFDPDQDIDNNPVTPAMAVDHYWRWVLGGFADNVIVRPCLFTLDDIRRELGGRDLACWCPPPEPCHIDVLLEIANA